MTDRLAAASVQVMDENVMGKSATITWDQLTAHTNKPNPTYIFTQTTGQDVGSVVAIAATAGAYEITGLLNNSDYAYSLQVRSDNDSNGQADYMKSNPQTLSFRTLPPILDTVQINKVEVTTSNIEVNWGEVPNAMSYMVTLYTDLNGMPTIVKESINVNATHTFDEIPFGTIYTIEVIAIAEGYRNSIAETTMTKTLRKILSAPNAEQINIGVIRDSIEVSWNNTQVEVEEYVIELVGERSEEADATMNGSITFSNLIPLTTYTVTVVSSSNGTRYINSPAYTKMIKTSYLGDLSAPVVSALTQNMRSEIKVSWSNIDSNALRYKVSLYEGANNVGTSAVPIAEEVIEISNGTMHVFTDVNGMVDQGKHYTAGVVAMADAYRASSDIRVPALPDILQASSFRLDRGLDTLLVLWDVEENSDFYNKTLHSILLFSIEDSNGILVGEKSMASTLARSHAFSALAQATNYVVKIALIAEIGGVALEGEALAIEFRTLEMLPVPESSLFRLEASPKEITVTWTGASQGVDSYQLTLSGMGDPVQETVDASSNSYAFEGLSPGTNYRLDVKAAGNEEIYVLSEALTLNEMTPPLPRLDEVRFNTAATVTTSRITLAWTSVADAISYTVNLYRGTNTNVQADRTIDIIATTHTFNELEFGTEYTIGITANADADAGIYRESSEALTQVSTKRIPFLTPTEEQINLRASGNVITVSWNNIPPELRMYIISIVPSPSLGMSPRRVDARQENEIAFEGLDYLVEYTITVIALGEDTRFIDSNAYTETIETGPRGTLDSSSFFAEVVTANRRTAVRMTLLGTPPQNAEEYTIKLYEGFRAGVLMEETIPVTETEYTFGSVDQNKFYTVGITAKAAGYIASREELFDAHPRALMMDSFILRPGSSTAAQGLIWSASDPNIIDRTYSSSLVISITNLSNHVRIIESLLVDPSDEFYSVESLEEGVTYEMRIGVRVRLNNANGFLDELEGESSVVFFFATPQVLPTPIAEQISWRAREDSIFVIFATTPAPNVQHYIFTLLNVEEGSEVEEVTIPVTNEVYIFRNLNPGTAYLLTVRAAGRPPEYLESRRYMVEITTSKPGQLGHPELSIFLRNTVDIQAIWGRITGASGYVLKLYRGTNSSGILEREIDTTEVGHTFKQLRAGTFYTVTAKAQGADQDDSELAIAALTTGKFMIPTPTADQITVDKTAQSLTVSWQDTPDEVTHYQLEISPDRHLVGQVLVQVSDRRYSFEMLIPNDFYDIIVVAIAPPTTYTASDVYVTDARTDQLPRLAPVEILSIVPSVDSIRVTWGDVPNAASYEILLKGSGIVDSITSQASFMREATFIQLEQGTDYRIEAVAHAPNYRSSIITLQGARTLLPLADLEISSVTPGVNDIEVTWGIVANATAYRASLYAGTDTAVEPLQSIETNSIAHRFRELEQPGALYTLEIIALADGYRSSVTSQQTRTLLPKLTQANTPVATPGMNDITVTWEEVSSATSYRVSLYAGTDAIAAPLQATTTDATSHIFTSLSSATFYTIELHAIADGYRESDPASITTRTLNRLLARPTSTQIMLSATYNSVTVQWNNTPAEVDIYLLDIDPDTANPGQKEVEVSNNEYTFTGLSADEEYTVSVVSSGDETRYTASEAYTESITTEQLPQLDTPALNTPIA
ncbi:MAG: fibronectin type III domain-containing protein, partial [Candidatus Oxydemutatoraceae bacterium WSBS_2016_MAG_OTU14]